MIKSLTSLYSPKFPTAIAYMLQSTEYQVGPYLRWLVRVHDYGSVQYRRNFERTKRARLLLLFLRTGIALQVIAGVWMIYIGFANHQPDAYLWGVVFLLSYPLIWALLITVPLILAKYLVVMPRDQMVIKESEQIFAKHSGIKIAVAGSYGKTTMKEILATVLGEGKKVAATPANKNVAISHALFARKLDGDEEVLIIEYGEGKPEDVAKFAETTHPTHAVITGLAPAHLDHYKTLDAAGEDIFAVADYLSGKNVYVHETTATEPFIKDEYKVFNDSGALGWQIKNVQVYADRTKFTIQKSTQKMELSTHLVGRHQVVFLTFAAAFALELGLTKEQVKKGIAKTEPFEHRMQPYELNAAQIIDDTYNGNLEGIRVGTSLLKDLVAKRKIYVTPGLVDQGVEKERVHLELGRLVAGAHPNLVILMKNSATPFIKKGLEEGGYKGQVQIEDQPLEFYSNLSHFVAAGDVVLMQNDWTDNYA